LILSPVRGGNGVKYDMFVDYDWGGEGTLNGTLKDVQITNPDLFFNETDGSSFPNGDMRQTHRAAAFMNWDRVSPPFVRDGCLYLPAAFVTHNGYALDEKTPLLRSEAAINKNGLRLQKLLGDDDSTAVVANVGWEQEFFAVDRDQYLQRPDLMATGRMLVGAQPPRGQQTDFNYFNRMQPRVRAFMDELTEELLTLGMPVSVFHNEVAPSQYEFSPIFKLTNVATDENTLAMEVMEDLAVKHNLAILFHEKPFGGVNGSGKHNNWGLNTDSGRNLFVPGKTDKDQASFIAMVACLARTLHVHGDVIRVGVATAGNDHRLGAQEAPPAIISLYTGDSMESHLQSVVDGGELHGYGQEQMSLEFGSKNVGSLRVPVEDRNRTAPFPFCGNRFEFRAVGSSQNCGYPLAIVNTAMAESMGILADAIEGGKSPRDAVADMLKEHWQVIFNGNGYSDEWPVEAAKRGLPNLRNTVDAVETLTASKNEKLFESQGVFSPTELKARQEIQFEKYTNDLTIEANCLINMLETGILPACAKDLQVFAGSSLGSKRAALYGELEAASDKLTDLYMDLPDGDAGTQARYCVNVIKPQMEVVRELSDTAERLVSAELWPYPKYSEILYDHHSGAPEYM
jgi:glutamine synthetase